MAQPNSTDFDLPQSNGAAVLTVDLGALADNYRFIRASAHGARTAGVVKANGYGCGADEVAETLAKAGCEVFFVATAAEGASLRQGCALQDLTIFVFNGFQPQDTSIFKNNRLTPVLNSVEEQSEWIEAARQDRLDYAVHIDTGMNRLGMTLADARAISETAAWPPCLVMSHLASASQPSAALNDVQRTAFAEAAELFPGVPQSLANSAGVFLGERYTFDLVRPGIALYGSQPIPGQSHALAPVVHLHAPILQVRTLKTGESVGYDETFTATRTSRIATLPLGYADGLLRAASNNSHGFIGGQKVSLVGRISMDLTCVDVTDIPENQAQPGTYVEILGKNIGVDELGAAAGSFGYEILTSLGPRYRRQYLRR